MRWARPRWRIDSRDARSHSFQKLSLPARGDLRNCVKVNSYRGHQRVRCFHRARNRAPIYRPFGGSARDDIIVEQSGWFVLRRLHEEETGSVHECSRDGKLGTGRSRVASCRLRVPQHDSRPAALHQDQQDVNLLTALFAKVIVRTCSNPIQKGVFLALSVPASRPRATRDRRTPRGASRVGR